MHTGKHQTDPGGGDNITKPKRTGRRTIIEKAERLLHQDEWDSDSEDSDGQETDLETLVNLGMDPRKATSIRADGLTKLTSKGKRKATAGDKESEWEARVEERISKAHADGEEYDEEYAGNIQRLKEKYRCVCMYMYMYMYSACRWRRV